MVAVAGPDRLDIHNEPGTKPAWACKPMLGFSTWSTQILDDVPGYGGRQTKPWFNEAQLKEISSVMKQRMPGYEYINMDSGWSQDCDRYGRWTYRRDLFPSGLRSLSDFLAKNGHKLGVYILPGIRKDAADKNLFIKGTHVRLGDIVSMRRQGNGFKDTTYMPDRHDHNVQLYYDSIAELFAEWGVSYVKADGCGPGGGNQFYPYQSPDNRACLYMMSNAFKKHNIWFELSWYLDHSYATEWAHIANGARIFIDIESYSTKTMTSTSRVFQRFEKALRWADKEAIGKDYGFFVDLDSVVVGMTVNGQCIDGLDNDDVRVSYISFWALLSSVFCIGSDPRMIPDKYLKLLCHPGILAIHQSGNMAHPLPYDTLWRKQKQIWWKPLEHGRICVGLFNIYTYPLGIGQKHSLEIQLSAIGITRANFEDVWTGEKLGTFAGSYKVLLRPGQCQMLILEPIQDALVC
ncbi:glycoside hydrolase superfamily [Spinellus fusiger]|nr:glycoside hydrolase superfamily [Spinellus fusiger]